MILYYLIAKVKRIFEMQFFLSIKLFRNKSCFLSINPSILFPDGDGVPLRNNGASSANS